MQGGVHEVRSTTAVERSGITATFAASMVVFVVGFLATSVVGGAGLFGLSSLALIGLAWLLGEATSQLGAAIGPRASGILNATCGNFPELVIVLFLISGATAQNGYLSVAKATIAGSILGNMLFVLGASLLVGALRNGPQRFGRSFARSQTNALLLAVVGIAIPTALASLHGPAARHIGGVSAATAGVLLIMYVAQLVHFLGGGALLEDADDQATGAPAAPEATGPVIRWSVKTSATVLGASAIAVAVVSHVLVSSISGAVLDLGISATFLGFVIVPIVGNVAEHFVAVLLAWRDDVDFALTVALGSAVQVAIGVAPVAVLASLFMTNGFDLAFAPIQMLALGLATFVVNVVVSDSRSTWLDGLQLLAIYVIVAIAFWY